MQINLPFFGLRFGANSTDRFTRTKPLQYLNYFFNQTKEEYVSVFGHEFDLYMTTPQLQLVINRDAQMLSNGRFVIKDKDGNEIENHPLINILENPNPFQNRNEWLMDMQIQKNIYGNYFLLINKPYSSAEPYSMVNLPSGRTRIVKSGKIFNQNKLEDIITRYEVQENDNKYTPYDIKDVLQLRISNPDNPLIGLSPLHGLTMPISNLRGAYGFRNRIIVKNGALGILSSSNKDMSGGIPLSADERKKIEEQYLRDYGTGDNQSSIMMTNASMSWQSMTPATKDLELFKEVDEDFKTIIDAYGHNENIYSTQNSSKYANMNEALKQVYQNRIIPEAEAFCYALSKKLGLIDKGQYIELDYSHLPVMQEDEKQKAETIKLKADAYSTLLANGINEKDARFIVGFES